MAVPQRCRGFALLIVLWALVLIAFVVAQVTTAGRTETRIASNLVANSEALAAADGAIYEAIFHLSDPRPEQRWALDGSEYKLWIGQTRIVLRLEDEADHINPNLASEALLEGLLQAVGSDPNAAGTLTQAITDWVGSAKIRRRIEELLAEYHAAGLDYGPPGAPLESLDELAGVRGMTASLFRALQPHLTLFGPAEPNAATTDPIVAAAIARSGSLASDTAGPSAIADALPLIVIARIHALAEGPGNARVRRTAVIRITTLTPAGYAPLVWGNDEE